MKHPRPKRMCNAAELTFKGKNKYFVVKVLPIKIRLLRKWETVCKESEK